MTVLRRILFMWEMFRATVVSPDGIQFKTATLGSFMRLRTMVTTRFVAHGRGALDGNADD